MALWTFVSKMTQLPTLETDNLVQIPEFSAEIRLPVAPELRLESTGLLILELLFPHLRGHFLTMRNLKFNVRLTVHTKFLRHHFNLTL